MNLRRMCILLLLGVTVGSVVFFKSSISLLIFYIEVLYIIESGNASLLL